MTCIENKLWFVELDVVRLWKIMVERMSLFSGGKIRTFIEGGPKK